MQIFIFPIFARWKQADTYKDYLTCLISIVIIYMRLQQDDEQVTVHVDDLKISCADEQIIKQTIEELHKTYKKINVTEGKELNCLELK
jgi:hypothetical protein